MSLRDHALNHGARASAFLFSPPHRILNQMSSENQKPDVEPPSRFAANPFWRGQTQAGSRRHTFSGRIMGRPLSLALLTTALAACIIGPACVDGFSSPLASSFGVCRGSAKLHSCSLPPRRSRAPLAPALRCSSEPTWDDGDKKEASVPAVDVPAQAVPEPNIEEVAEVATRSALQELADKARAKAEAGGIGGLGGGSGAFLWKEQLSRRMEEASATFEAVPLPGFNLASVGLKGR